MVFVTDKAFLEQTKKLVKQAAVPVTVKTIVAGKFRRYMDMALWKQVLHPDIGGRNLVDMFKVAGGVAQSIRLVRKFRPDVVFAKGGYVSLPVGYAASLLRVPLVIHDSDARPGLTSRVLSRWASAIALGLPVKSHRYNADKTIYTGIPIDDRFEVYDEVKKKTAKKSLGVDLKRPLVAVTGGGLGSRNINTAILAVAEQLVKSGYSIYHVTGAKLFKEVKSASKGLPKEYQAIAFRDSFADLYGAADVVIARAGATTLQELAAAARPAVIIPAGSLGDQPENAAVYAEAGAIKVIADESLVSDPNILVTVIDEMLSDKAIRDNLTKNIAELARPNAARTVADMLVSSMKKRKTKR